MSECDIDTANPDIDPTTAWQRFTKLSLWVRSGRRLANAEQFDPAHTQAHLMVGGYLIAQFLCIGLLAPPPVPGSVPFGKPGRLHP